MSNNKHTGPLKDTERYTIVNALRAAADVYREDAEKFSAADRLRKQFVSQAESAERWADLIEDAKEVIVR